MSAQNRRWRSVVGASAAGLAVLFVSIAQGAQAISAGSVVTTYDYSNARSGQDTVSAKITGLSHNPSWNTKLDGAVYGEPLLYGGRIYVATENDSLFALNPRNGTPVWQIHLGHAVARSLYNQAPGLGNCGNIDPLGITSTPVIDPTTNTLYAVEETVSGPATWQNIHHVMVAISLSAQKVTWSRRVDPPRGNQVDQNGYTIPALLQRPALTLTSGRVYANFGGLSGDCGIYHGYVVGMKTNGVGDEVVYRVPTTTQGAIWATNGALVSPQGNLYVSTGNGSSTTTFDGSNAILELSPTLKLLSQWAPPNWATLSASDWDLGSAGPIYIPGTSLMFISGKPQNGSFGYLVSSTALGNGPGPSLFTGNVCADPNSGVFGADASAMVTLSGTSTPVIFAACQNGTEALAVTTGGTPSFHQLWGPSSTSSGGPPIVSGGVLWALDYVNFQLVGLSPATGHVIFQRPTANLNHFATPTIGDGLVVIPTHKGVEAYATTP